MPRQSPSRFCAVLIVSFLFVAEHALAQSEEPSDPTSADESDVITEILVLGRRPGDLVPDTVTRRLGEVRNAVQGISVIPDVVIEQQNPRETFDVVLNNASAQPGDEFFGEYSLRGFTATRATNGIPEPTFANNATFNETAHLERVEIIKGPASLLIGTVSPGGIINRVTARPRAEPGLELEVAAGSEDFFETDIDATGALGNTDRFNGRLVASFRASESFRNFVGSDRAFLAPSMDISLSPTTSLLLTGYYRDEDSFLDDGLPTLADGSIAPVPLDRNLQEPTDSISYESYGISAFLQHEPHDELSFTLAAYYQDDEEDRVSTRYFGDVGADGRTQPRFFLDQLQTYDNAGLQADVRWEFRTGGLRHELIVGADLNRTGSEGDAIVDFAAPIDIFDPIYGQPRLGLDLADIRSRDIDSFGLFAQDRVFLFDESLVLVAGLRYDDADLDATQAGDLGSAEFDFSRSETSPRLGAVYRATDGLSFYASWGNSFESPDPDAGFLNPGVFPEPELGEQLEAGARSVFFDSRAYASVAVFRLTKENVATADPDDPLRVLQIGEQESEGVEFEAAGELLPGLLVTASAAYTRTEVTRDTTGLAGNELPNVPEFSASFYTRYAFSEGSSFAGLNVGLGVFHRGERYSDIGNSTRLDSYTRVDGSLRYEWEKLYTELNIENLFDEEYFQTGTIPGDLRTVEARVGYRF